MKWIKKVKFELPPSSPAGTATSISPSDSEVTASACSDKNNQASLLQRANFLNNLWIEKPATRSISASPDFPLGVPCQGQRVGETRSARSSGNQNQTHITCVAACSLSVVDCLPQQTRSRWQSWLCISSTAQRNLWMVVGTSEDKNWQWWSMRRKTISHLNELWHEQCWNPTYENPHCLENYC